MTPPAAPRKIRHLYRLFALVPGTALLAGVPFINDMRAFWFGWPALVVWMVFWILMIALTQAVLWSMDKREFAANAGPEGG